MKIGTLLLALLVHLPFTEQVTALSAPALPRGEDVIDVPAKRPGLFPYNLFQSNMVLQRDKPIRIGGWAEPGKNVSVHFMGHTARSPAAADGRWRVELPAQPAQTTPQERMISSGMETITLDNLLIGDVWVLGGQSNMEHSISRVEDGQLETLSAHLPQVRHLTVPQPNRPDYRDNFPRLIE